MERDFRLGEWRVAPRSGCLSRAGRRRQLPNQVMEVLLFLARRPGEVVSKEELVRGVWGGRSVSDQTVSTAVYELRKALEDDAASPRYLETIRKRGYRLLARPRPMRQAARPGHLPVVAAALLAVAGAAVLIRAGGVQRLVEPPGPTAEACNAYLLGARYLDQGTSEGVRKAETYFHRAIELDPEWAPAHAGLASAYAHAGSMVSGIQPAEASERATRAATRALQASEGSAEAESILADIEFRYHWNWSAAGELFRRAAADSTCGGRRGQRFAEYLSALGRHEDAVRAGRAAVEEDPLSSRRRRSLAWILYMSRRYDEALAALEELLEMDPSSLPAYDLLGDIHLQLGRFDQAVTAFQQSALLRGVEIARLRDAHDALERDGLAGLLAWRRANLGCSGPGAVAGAVDLARLGDLDQALEWLERAAGERRPELVWLLVHPGLDPLREDVRFLRLIRQVGFPGGRSS